MAHRLSRRAFLGGGSALAIGLPWLEAMTPRDARAGGNAAPLRFLAFYTPNGMPMADWRPQAQGPGYDLPPALLDLADVRDHVSVLSGLQNHAVDANVGHAVSTAGFLTGTRVADSETDLHNTTSVDQLYAASILGQTPISSLALGLIGGGNIGTCDGGSYSCAYTRNISWIDSTPIPRLISPQAAFDLLFAGTDPDQTDAEKTLRKVKRLSLLDGVLGEADALHARLGTADRIKLDEYLASVRDLEQRVAAEDVSGPACPAVAPAAAVDIDAKTRAMIDVIALAFACDRTRAVTFMCGDGLNSLDFSHLGFTDAHHGISHALGQPGNAAKYLQIAQWEVRMFATLVARLRDLEEGDGSVLDQSVLYFANEISRGDAHTHDDLPILLAGGGGGTLSPGRHVHYPSAPPVADLFIALLGVLGMNVTSFGADGSAPLGQL